MKDSRKVLVKKKNTLLALGIILSILAAAGIPLIPIGFVFKGLWLIGGIGGIVFIGVGFYGLPFIWIGYASSNVRIRIYDCIMLEHLYKVNEIAVQLNTNEDAIANNINYLIRNHFLLGYLFDGKEITLNEHKELQKKIIDVCPYCGSKNMLKIENGYKCAYCGAKAIIE